MLLRNAKPAHSDATDIPSLDDLQILFLENGDPSDQGGSNEPVRRKGSLSLLISNPTTTVHYFWRKFDDKFMRPVFGYKVLSHLFLVLQLVQQILKLLNTIFWCNKLVMELQDFFFFFFLIMQKKEIFHRINCIIVGKLFIDFSANSWSISIC